MRAFNLFACLAKTMAMAMALTSPARADSPLPDKPVRLVVSLGAGSGPDSIARRIGEKLAPAVGRVIVIENRPGVSGILAADSVVKAVPDGSSLAFAMGSTIGIAPHVYTKIPYDTVRDLRPVIQVGTTPFVLLVNAADPARTLAQFIANAKIQPDSFSFASFGNGTAAHLIGAELCRAAGIKMLHIPYKTSAIPDLIGGRINASVGDLGTARPHLGPGRALRALAVSGPHRNAAYPDVPTFGEQGFPSFDAMVGWVGVFAPAAAPVAVTDSIAREIRQIVNTPELRDSMALLGYESTGQVGDAFVQTVRRDHARWGKAVKDIGGITLD